MHIIGLTTFLSSMGPSENDLLNERGRFLASIDPKGDFIFKKPSREGLNVFYIQTGGSEAPFKAVYEKYQSPYYLLVSGERNSLASALEILTFLQQQNLEGVLIYGEPKKIHDKLLSLALCYETKRLLRESNLGVIGDPSDWLISSTVDQKLLKKKLGVNLVKIPMSSFYNEYKKGEVHNQKAYDSLAKKTKEATDLKASMEIYGALKNIVSKERLNGLTVRCFDPVKKLKETPCLALGLLNAEGIPAACEGDVPSLLSMMIAKGLFNQSAFMANPARVDLANKKAIFAHCSCPFDMITSYSLTTHFESGIGLAIRGTFRKKDVTLFKLSPDLSSIKVFEGKIVENLVEPRLCRSQIEVEFSEDISSLLSKPFGNHVLFVYGHQKGLLSEFSSLL